MSLHLDTSTPNEIATCVNKTRYGRKMAKYTVYVMRKRMKTGECAYPAEGYRLHAYKCPVCDCWHVGNIKESL